MSEQEAHEEAVEPIEAPHRKVAHYHPADKRAGVQGVISGQFHQGAQTRQPCLETQYAVKCPGGLRINERLYLGRVTVPECVANYLSEMDCKWERAERDLFRNNPVQQNFEVGR